MKKQSKLFELLKTIPIISLPYRTYRFWLITKRYWALSKSEDEEADSAFIWNEAMYMVRILLESNEKYRGGLKGNWRFTNDAFTQPLKTGEAHLGGTKIPEEDMLAIGEAWFSGELYQRVLEGDPGVFAGVHPYSVRYFWVILEDAVCADLSYWQGCQHHGRGLSWSGYERYGVSWTED